nr:RNA-directed DNA polymerase, eukaryota [Tanacetum cinerariifolium]
RKYFSIFDDHEDILEHNSVCKCPSAEKEVSSDPFNLNDLINKHKMQSNDDGNLEKESSLPFPPGFTPKKATSQNDDHNETQGDAGVKSPIQCNSDGISSRVMEDAQTVNSHELTRVEHNIETSDSILDVLENMIKVGNTIGLGSKAKKDWIKEINNKHKVNFLSIQETKLDVFSDVAMKTLWSNHRFEYIINEAVGNSEGILCVWDPSFFLKEQHIVSDNFVALYGTWVPKKIKLLVITVYAPQPLTSKRALWDYLMSLINRWDGHCLVMGDFNEVRSFFVTDGLISLFPHLSAVCLDKNLSDHRPILLREVVTDFGPSPFRVYHSWFDYKGVLDTWNNIILDDSNKMVRFKKKLQALKKKIQAWINDYKQKHFGCVKDSRSKLHDIDIELDKGGSNDDILLARMDLMKRLNDIQSSEARDKFQKAKIHWAVEGYENSKFFMDENKSPGPDEFTFKFFRKYWDTLGSDFYAAVEWFFEHFMFARGCNSSFIALIPKTQDPKFVSDFRPISLIGSLYKVVTKILANRLSSVISDLISEVQTAFLPNRQILDGPFIINELLSWCKYKKQQAMVFKVDFAKAYDSVRWDFLDDVLDAFGFGSKWRSWIHGSLHSGMASVLINVSPSLEFKFQRGLKQGDPLAPYLFLLIMESLHLLFSRAVDAGIFQGINISEDLKISHLFYADDASHLLGAGVPFKDVNSAAMKLGCSTMRTPFKYIGVMVGGNTSTVHAWDDIIAKVKTRLSNWKLNTLSVGGRLTLLKSVLGSTPIYTMSIYKVPKAILHTLEAIRWNFFNGVHEGERKITWVSWPKILTSKKHGGLGVSSFYALNRALLFKWVWRFISGDNSLWFRFIKSIYGTSLSNASSFMFSIWNRILKVVSLLKDRGVDLLSHCHIRVRNGLRTQFWNEVWIAGAPLCVLFPRIYALESVKDCSMESKIHSSVTHSFCRDVRGGVESSQLALLEETIGSVILSNLEDRWVWDMDGEWVFRVKDVRNLLDDCFLPKADTATRWLSSVNPGNRDNPMRFQHTLSISLSSHVIYGLDKSPLQTYSRTKQRTRMRMEVLLEIHEVWDVVDLGSDNVKKNNIVKGLLFQAIPEDLVLQIENLKTRKKINDTIDTYAAKLSGIASKSAMLGEVMSEHKPVKKFLTSLPRRFVHIIAALEQFLDLKTIRTEYFNESNDLNEGRGCGSYSRGRGRGRGQGRGRGNSQNQDTLFHNALKETTTMKLTLMKHKRKVCIMRKDSWGGLLIKVLRSESRLYKAQLKVGKEDTNEVGHESAFLNDDRKKLDSTLKKIGFLQCVHGKVVYRKVPNREFIIFAINVDDLFVIRTSLDLINEFKRRMVSQFEMSDLDELTYYLGIEVSQGKDCLEIKQERYVMKILKEAGMEDCNTSLCQMELGLKL